MGPETSGSSCSRASGAALVSFGAHKPAFETLIAREACRFTFAGPASARASIRWATLHSLPLLREAAITMEACQPARLVQSLEGHSDRVWSVAWSPLGEPNAGNVAFATIARKYRVAATPRP